ncbi:MAG: tetratricopeptide repeat protein [Acidobacteriota bacterium]|nr:tetratricopeptide repeat protein [Acidobacteriota bacterium]
MTLRLATGLLLLTGVLPAADDYLDLCREASAYTQQGNYDLAIVKYQAALAIRPHAPEALNNLAVVYYQVRKYSEAFETASEIWKDHPELKSAALIAGMAAVQCNRPKEAIAPLTQLLKLDDRNRDALLALASAHLGLNDFAEAAKVYERQTNNSPADATAWYGRAICYEHMAESASKDLSRTPGGAPYSKRLLAEYLQSAGDSRLAAEAFGQAQLMPAVPSAQALKLYETARDLAQKSRESFEQLIKIAPNSWEAAVFLGDVDRQHGDLVSALAHYKRAADQQPGNPAPLLGLSTTYWEMGDFDHASASLEETLKLNPKARQAVFELANIAVRRHRDAEAIPLLKQYLSEQPDALAAHADLGRAYFHLGQYENAVLEFAKAAPSDEHGDIHYEMSLALRKLARPGEADEALKESKALREAELKREERLHSDK